MKTLFPNPIMGLTNSSAQPVSPHLKVSPGHQHLRDARQVLQPLSRRQVPRGVLLQGRHPPHQDHAVRATRHHLALVARHQHLRGNEGEMRGEWGSARRDCRVWFVLVLPVFSFSFVPIFLFVCLCSLFSLSICLSLYISISPYIYHV